MTKKYFTSESLTTLINTIKELFATKTEVDEVKASVEILENTHPDWDENDKTSDAYIENKPFYELEPIESIIYEGTVDGFALWDGAIYMARVTNGADYIDIDSKYTYTVIWDGVSYENLKGFDDWGNNIGAADNDFSVYPFRVWTSNSTGNVNFYTLSTEASHTVKVIKILPNIKTIDAKFLEIKPGLVLEKGSTVTYSDIEYIIGSHAEVFNDVDGNLAFGNYSHAEGCQTVARGDYSHTEGYQTIAIAYAHAEGSGTKALGWQSHTEGGATIANGTNGHAEGFKTEANGQNSHTEGKQTKASSDDQHVQGRFNIEDTSNTYAHIVGNGETDTARSNAHTLDWDGNAWFAGDVKIGGNSIDDINAKTLATTDDIATAFENITVNSATKATQDASGNVITSTYETKADATSKLNTAKAYTDSEIAELVGDIPVEEQINNTIVNYYTKSEIDTYEFITAEEIHAICGGSMPDASEVLY